MDPALYGEEWHPKCVKMHCHRQDFEFKLIAEVEKRRMPALGICFGSQLMNVYRGGSLIQFLPDHERDNALEHRRVPDRSQGGMRSRSTWIRSLPGDRQKRILRQHVPQAGGEENRPRAADHRDGAGWVIEAFEDPTFPLFAAVQWHPERLIDEKEHLAPFELLVKRSAEARER
jgi:putative glutamine amidotransferase